jgi:hypothetical protein
LSHNKLNHLSSYTVPSLRRNRPSDDATLLRKSILILNSIQYAADVAAENAWREDHWFEGVMQELGTDESSSDEEEVKGEDGNRSSVEVLEVSEEDNDDVYHFTAAIAAQSPQYTYSPPLPSPQSSNTTPPSMTITSSPPPSPQPTSVDSFSDEEDLSDEDDGPVTPPLALHDTFSGPSDFYGSEDDYEFGASDDEGDFIEDTRSLRRAKGNF